MNILLQCFFHHKRKMRAFGAVTIIVFACILVFFKGRVKHFFCLLYLHADFGQVRKLHRCAVFVNKCLYVEAIKLQVFIFYFKTFLGKIKCLFYEIQIGIVHSARS